MMNFLYKKPAVVESQKQKLQKVKSNAFKCQRELKRDRNSIDKIEASLMIQLKAFAKKGDLIKANMLARQIALYRNVSDVNFQRSTMIDLQAQLMCSNHIIHRAQIDNIKQINHSNLFTGDDASMIKNQKFTEIACHQADMDMIMREGMEEVYASQEEQISKPNQLEQDINNIMRQALDPKCHGQYMNRIPDQHDELPIQIHLRVHHPQIFPDDTKVTSALTKPDGATITIPTLDISVDMLKREISQDFFAIKQLEIGNNANPAFDAALGNVKPFKIGKLVQDIDEESKRKCRFVAFDFTQSLKGLEIENGDTVWLKSLNAILKVEIFTLK